MYVRLPKLSRGLVVGIVIATVVIAMACFALYRASSSRIPIPASVTDAVTFPIYVPKSLPQGFTLDTESFKYVTGEGILVFQATDTAGDALVFSEQAKPANFNFNDFNTRQMVNPKKLPNVPFSTTTGKTLDKQTTFMSIVTGKTWLIVSTQAELTNQQLHEIAAGISQY